MKYTTRTSGLLIGAATLGFAAATVVSQPEPAKPPPAPPPAAALGEAMSVADIRALLEPAAAVVEEHDLLAALVGSSRTEWRMFTGPGAGPITSHGATTGEWILGKRFVAVKTAVGSSAPDKEFVSETLSIYGFDTRTRKYTVVSFDTLGTYWVSAAGGYDKESKELRLLGSAVENGETMRFKWTVKLGENRSTTKVELKLSGDEWMKVTEVVNEGK